MAIPGSSHAWCIVLINVTKTERIGELGTGNLGSWELRNWELGNWELGTGKLGTGNLGRSIQKMNGGKGGRAAACI